MTMKTKFNISYPSINSVIITKSNNKILVEEDISNICNDIWSVIEKDLINKINNSEIDSKERKEQLLKQLEDLKIIFKKKVLDALNASSPGTIKIIWDLGINVNIVQSEIKIDVLYLDIESSESGIVKTVWRKK